MPEPDEATLRHGSRTGAASPLARDDGTYPERIGEE